MPNSPIQPAKPVAAAYRDCFATPDGMIVLADIMDRGKIFKPLDSERDIGRRNLATEIMMLALAEKSGTDKTGRARTLLNGRRFMEVLQTLCSKRRRQ